MDRKLRELGLEELGKLPSISNRNWLGEEKIYIHLWNSKKMNWYLAEFDAASRMFYGFSENRNDGISSGSIYLDELLGYERKGSSWEVLVDSKWKPVYSKDISILQGYINLMTSLPDIV
jgi:hypothetical protein